MSGWVAGAIVVGGGISAYASSKSASKAADAQTQAADQANQTQRDQYSQTRADSEPWRKAGADALGQLSAGTQPDGQFMHRFGMSDFQTDPGYAFRKQQGQDALDNAAASHGGLLSGAQLKASSQYNQDFASNEYGNAYNRFNTDQSNQYNRLAGVAGTGQVANQLNAQSGANMANNVSANQIGVGNARGSSYIAQGNALSGLVGQGVNAFGQYNAMNPQWGGGMRGINLDVNGQGLTGNAGGGNSLASYGLAGSY